MSKTYFISGIDTDTGKSIATGLMAKWLLNQGKHVITQKMIQTGCVGIAEDILTHRKLMGVDLFEEDKDKTTCPITFPYPASPHLSAALENQIIDPVVIRNSTAILSRKYEYLLVEGAGGLHVPLNDQTNIIDYIQKEKHPLILVTSSKLGSINHTLMSLELCKNRGIEVSGLIYNHYPNNSKEILEDSSKVFERFLERWFPECVLIQMPEIKDQDQAEINFKELFS
ncbi:MAG: ATP-dependent dethiobiotin synthetase BioD [Bacteroidales bacterium]|nr:ATP-dependent dethiobiotin synthetase BioD [Bacteroidales bacterium]